MPFDDNNRDSDSDDKRGKPDDNLSQNGSGADTPKKDERPKTVLRQGTTPAGGSLTQKDIPQEFGHLRLIKKIGHEGGMGVVFQAQNINLDSERAVKILHPMLAQRKDIAGSFVREAQITDKLDHPNIVRVYEVGTFSEFFFIEMELIDTFELPPSNQLPIDISLIVCLKVCEALQFSHTASFKHKNQQIDGVVHRDVKPGNILVSKTGQVKLADFGIAKLASAESLTMAGVGPVGTFSYMSPEQLNDEKDIDRRTDIYSLGVVLYEYLAGRQAFSGTITNIMANIAQNKYAPMSSVRKDIPKEVDRIIRKSMARDRNARYQSAKEMRDDIYKYLLSINVRNYDERLRSFIRKPTASPIPKSRPRDWSGLLDSGKKVGLIGGAVVVVALVVWGVMSLVSYIGNKNARNNYQDSLAFIESYQALVPPGDSVFSLLDSAAGLFSDEEYGSAADRAADARNRYRQVMDSVFDAAAERTVGGGQALVDSNGNVVNGWDEYITRSRGEWADGQYQAAFVSLTIADSIIGNPPVIASPILKEMRRTYQVKAVDNNSFKFSIDDQGVQLKDLSLDRGSSGLGEEQVYLDGGLENPRLRINAALLEPGTYTGMKITVSNIDDKFDSRQFRVRVVVEADSLRMTRDSISASRSYVRSWKTTFGSNLAAQDINSVDSVLSEADRVMKSERYLPSMLKAREAINMAGQKVRRAADRRIGALAQKAKGLRSVEALDDIQGRIIALRATYKLKKYSDVFTLSPQINKKIEYYLNLPVVDTTAPAPPPTMIDIYTEGTHQQLLDSATIYVNDKRDVVSAEMFLEALANRPQGELPLNARQQMYHLFASIYLYTQDYDKADKYCDDYREVAPNNFYPHYLSAKVAFSQHRYQDALSHMDEARAFSQTIKLSEEMTDIKKSQEWHDVGWFSNMSLTELVKDVYRSKDKLSKRQLHRAKTQKNRAIELWSDYLNTYKNNSGFTDYVKLGQNAYKDLREI